jgi:glycine betaine/proline transport system ATP-binding protein
MVRMINRLIEPTSGQVLIDGEEITTMPDDQLVKLRRSKLSMVFQSFALMPHMNVLQNAAFGLEMDGVDLQTREARALEALEQVGLGAWAESMPNELSGGMQQRVGLARGLAVDPDILLMDEAFSALDPLIRTEMQDELLKLQSKARRTIVFISHDLDEAMRIGDRIAIMEGGRVVQIGSPEEILQNPADDYVRAFFRGVDPTNILSAGDIATNIHVTIPITDGKNPRAGLQRLIKDDREYAYVIDSTKVFKGIVSIDSLREMLDDDAVPNLIHNAYLNDVVVAHKDDSLQDILPKVAGRPWPLPILDEDNRYLGAVSKNLFLRTLHRN